jgi:hypothetical protein
MRPTIAHLQGLAAATHRPGDAAEPRLRCCDRAARPTEAPPLITFVTHLVRVAARGPRVPGVTYAALATMLVIPGTNTDALFLTGASLWDVRSEYLYLSSQAEGTARQTRPQSWVSERTVLAEAKAGALAAVAKNVEARLAAMR